MSRLWEIGEGAMLGALFGVSVALLGVTAVLKSGDPALYGALGATGGALVGALRRIRWLVVLNAPVVLLLLIVSLVPWTGLAARWVRVDVLPSAPVDAVVVLSAGMFGDSAVSSSGLDRLLTGIDLVQRGLAPRLITTRVVYSFGGIRVTNDADVSRVVRLAGVDSAWTMVDSVLVTHDEAVRTARLLLPEASRIIVVTSPSHTRRACATFEKVGFRVWCRPAIERTRRPEEGTGPEARLSTFGALIYEMAGTVKYRLEGWI